MNKLYNIFCHYLVNNSFDTHFIIDNIDRLNKACIESRAGAIQKLKELKQENDLNNESFNPFIEVNEKEESKFVDLNSQEHINKAAEPLIKILKPVIENIKLALSDWLPKRSSPEMLNLQSKQHNLKQKLKWERMCNSEQKLFKLRKALKTMRMKKPTK